MHESSKLPEESNSVLVILDLLERIWIQSPNFQTKRLLHL